MLYVIHWLPEEPDVQFLKYSRGGGHSTSLSWYLTYLCSFMFFFYLCVLSYLFCYLCVLPFISGIYSGIYFWHLFWHIWYFPGGCNSTSRNLAICPFGLTPSEFLTFSGGVQIYSPKPGCLFIWTHSLISNSWATISRGWQIYQRNLAVCPFGHTPSLAPCPNGEVKPTPILHGHALFI